MASLYLHIPFCEKKCPYCDFYSIEGHRAHGEFLRALAREIRIRSTLEEDVDTVFFGGGTPSLLEPDELGAILDLLREGYRIASGAEITLEANPGTVDRSRLRAFRSLGINRLSLGVQSFRPEELRFLGRIHSSDDALQAVGDARASGFQNVSIDLLYSLPGQNPFQWQETLETALALEVEHISAYSLIVEAGTPLAEWAKSGEVKVNPVEVEAALYEQTMAFFARGGYEQYEVSNYARPGFRCRHNLAYWSHRNYLGFGPSAHSFWRSRGAQRARRWWNISSLTAYLERLSAETLPVGSQEMLGEKELINERIFLGLRSTGVDLAEIEAEFQFNFPERVKALVAELAERGLGAIRGTRLSLTPKGYLLCDEIARRMLL
jgi:oxygen-independent coproporphyrinogen-3 oxidase